MQNYRLKAQRYKAENQELKKQLESARKQTQKFNENDFKYFKESFEKLRVAQEQQNSNVNKALSMINEKMPMLHQLIPVLAIPVAPELTEGREKGIDVGCRQSEVLQKTIRGMLVALEWLAVKRTAGSTLQTIWANGFKEKHPYRNALREPEGSRAVIKSVERVGCIRKVRYAQKPNEHATQQPARRSEFLGRPLQENNT